MTGLRPPKVVILGMLSKMPVGGVAWQTLHYLVGLRRLGYDPYYVEAHARTPGMLMVEGDPDGSAAAADYLGSTLGMFGFGDRWAFHALHADGRCFGLTEAELRSLYGAAALLINLHGGTEPLEEHAATGRLVYLETDPVQLQVELLEGRQEAIDFLAPHVAFFTFAEAYGTPGCLLPESDRFQFQPTRQPVVIDLWETHEQPGPAFTTVGNWRQPWRDVRLGGEVYRWSKHLEFARFLDLPTRTSARFELALSGVGPADRATLEEKGWAVRPALGFTRDPEAYRDYIRGSRAEFTVAKDQNVRLRTGWFSDRSATYLAAGRPVVTQETGFSSVLPTGEGLFAFSTLDEAEAAVEAIQAEPGRHARAASAVARDRFAHEVVLASLLDRCGVAPVRRSLAVSPTNPFPDGMPMMPVSRWPTRLAEATVRAAAGPVPACSADDRPVASVVVVTHNGLPFTQLCLRSVLWAGDGDASAPSFEVLLVDNGSEDGTANYVLDVARHNGRVRTLFLGTNLGFAAACNRGLAEARGDVLVLLNNDTIVPPAWLAPLCERARDPSVGLVGPVSNRVANEARIDVPYRTYGEFVRFARDRRASHRGIVRDLGTAIMFCVAVRRDVFDAVGPLDERFGVGLFEDDDYSLRVRRAGYRVACAEELVVHHFGQATIGHLAGDGRYGELFATNRRRFEEKWGLRWDPHPGRQRPEYDRLVDGVRAAVDEVVPSGATLLVVSRGDDALLELGGRRAWHFPRDPGGGYAGFYPANGYQAVGHLEELARAGATFLIIPDPYRWWLEYYPELREHLDRSWSVVADQEACLIYRRGQAARIAMPEEARVRVGRP